MWHIGERVVTREGRVVTVVAIDREGRVFAIGPGDRVPRLVRPVTDAFGGEHDAALGMAA